MMDFGVSVFASVCVVCATVAYLRTISFKGLDSTRAKEEYEQARQYFSAKLDSMEELRGRMEALLLKHGFRGKTDK